MKTLTIGRSVVKVYDSVDEMPIVNFQKYNKFLLIDSGVGSDMDDVDAHVTRIAKFVKAGDAKKAMQELQNMRQTMHMINSEISPKYLAFAALVHSIDGREVTDLSDDGLKKVLADLRQARHSTIVDFLLWIKKKISEELETYFPENFESVKEKEIYDKIKSRTLLILDSIINEEDHDDQVEAIDLELLNAFPPKSFQGRSSAEVQYIKQFESACFLIAQKSGMDATKMTVLQFYSAIDSIKKQAEAESKSLKLNKVSRHGR